MSLSTERYRTRLLALSKDTLGYGWVDVLSLASGLVTLPLLTRSLGSASYGQLDLLLSLVVLFGTLVRLGVPMTLSRVFERRRADGSLASFYSSSLWALALFALVATALTRLLGELFPSQLADDFPPELVSLAVAIGCVQALLSAPEMVLRMERRLAAYGTNHAVSILAYLGALVWLAQTSRLNVQTALLAYLMTSLLGLLLFVYSARHLLCWSWEPGVLRHSLRFGGPLLLGRLSHRIAETAHRAILVTGVGLVEAGLLAVAARIVRLASPPLELSLRAWQPSAMLLLDERQNDVTLRRDFRTFVALSTLVVLTATAAAPAALLILVPDTFSRAVSMVPWLTGAMALQSATSFTRLGSLAAQRTGGVAAIAITSSLFGILITLLLVRPLGGTGAAIGMISAHALACLGCWRLSSRQGGPRLDVGFFGRCVAWTVVGCAVLSRQTSILSSLSVGAVVITICAALLWLDLRRSTAHDGRPVDRSDSTLDSPSLSD